MGKNIGFAAVPMVIMCSSYNLYADRKKERERSEEDVSDAHQDVDCSCSSINRISYKSRGQHRSAYSYEQTCTQNSEAVSEQGNRIVGRPGVECQSSKGAS